MAIIHLPKPQPQIPVARLQISKVSLNFHHTAAGPNTPLLVFSFVKHGPDGEVLGSEQERVVVDGDVRALLEKGGNLEETFAAILANKLGIVT